MPLSTQQAYNPEFITPIKPKHNWRILSDKDLDLLKEATFRMLNEVGVQFPLDDATVQELERILASADREIKGP